LALVNDVVQTVAAIFHKNAVVLGHDWFSICACYLAKFCDDTTDASICRQSETDDDTPIQAVTSRAQMPT
jgi:hypothetical protein